MADLEMESLTPTASFRSSEEHSSSSIDLKKKRKLQHDLSILDMPSPKQRLRIGTNIFEEPIIRETQNDLEQENSENDSNSFVTTYDNLMASDVKVADENSITLTVHQEQPSTSLNNSSNRVNKDSLYSLESRGFKEVSDATTADLEEILQLDLGHKVAEEMYSSFEEFESEGDAETESLVLYSNDVAPHSFLRSSGCWNLGQDAPLGIKKPTIDQEFEQYFSSLML